MAQTHHSYISSWYLFSKHTCLYILLRPGALIWGTWNFENKTVLMRNPQMINCFISIFPYNLIYCLLVRLLPSCCIFTLIYFNTSLPLISTLLLSPQRWRQVRVTDLCWSSSMLLVLIAMQSCARPIRFLRPARAPLPFITSTWRTVCLLLQRKSTSPAPITPKSWCPSRNSYLSSSWRTSQHGKTSFYYCMSDGQTCCFQVN